MDEIQFNSRFEKLRAYNESRLKKAVSIMNKRTVDILNIVPILLNYNTPKLPGYKTGDVPFGIDLFKPNDFQRSWLIEHGVDPDEKIEPYYPVYGLYAMGSTASIAQGQESDLDIWVCVSKSIPFHEINLLTDKCRFISNYAKALGCEVNLFVTTEDRFTNGEHGTMDTEDCGSAQSLFLLDEFYRTSLRLCGRYLAWYIIPEQDEINDYTKAISSFYNSPFVRKEEWFDFGSVAKCSPVEYFGSGLWLVYKGIDHPLKAVLKILLMETYASEYPSTRLLSMQLKEAVMTSSKFSLRHDPYYLMYRKVITYLRDQNDTARQNLARICFYLKLRNGIIGMPKCKELGFRTRFLRRICRIWGWNLAYSEKIDNVDKWKISSVRPLLHQLLSSLLESYKSLLRFSVEHRIEYAITSDDAGILSRKIYAAYDRYPGKILHVTGDFSHRLEEENLTLIRPSKHSVCQMGWHAYTCVDSSIDLLSQKPVYIAGGIVEMVTWATVSKVISERTNVFIRAKNSSVTEDKVRELSFDIKNFILNASLAVTEADLQKPRRVVRTLLVVNFEKDVTKDFLISASDLEIGSALSCGRQKMCLIGSVDIVNINSWGEISCNSFSYGEDGILDVLASLLNSHEQRSEVENDDSKETFQVNKVNDIRVCCYSNVHKDLIRYDLEAVIRGIFNCKFGYDSRFIFNVGHNEYESRVDETNMVSIVRHAAFRASDYDVTILSRFGMRPEYALQVPSVVERCASAGIVQYFFVKTEKSWDIIIVNEKNEVRIFSGFKGSRSALVNAINRFYTQKSDDQTGLNAQNFNLPQYFVLDSDHNDVHPFTISTSLNK